MTRKLSLAALCIALSAVGAAIKIPAVIGSVALDIFPSLIAAAILGGGAGAVIASFGHLLSALIGGMPLGPFHLIIAIEMAIIVALFGWFYRIGHRKKAGLIFWLGNTFAAPLPFLLLMGREFYVAIVPSLAIGSALNVVLALAVAPRLTPIFVREWGNR
ncbi:ECF transporter S component [Lederbergia citrea]|uniref:ECF transporter S component n=1 Tax=Lederbergia citrea TaxID=2833581 RepID=A0A942URI5_9BACI|nr:ECF transporter S component [Lederbergia citrea]MBS4178023.1 ECF transporter S component [Lederbergia citrea]MBS4204690.1 ECF transporter S component [Lederbergia citrea]MBS4223463.1 ECF transporter S component [Lederbergia citrea]